MVRIDLDDPYEAFLEAQVREGFFSSATDAVKDAIRKQMDAHEKARIAGIHMLIAKGEADIRTGRTVPYTPGLMQEISEQGKQAALAEKPVKHDVR